MKNENEYILTKRHFVANRFLPIRAEFYPQADCFRTDYTENTDLHRLFLTKLILTKPKLFRLRLGSFG